MGDQKNYMINKYGNGPDNLSKGSTEYNDLLSKRYRAQGDKDLEDLNSKYIHLVKHYHLFFSYFHIFFLNYHH